MPTSITVAPGLIQSPRTISGLPTAAIRISASAADRRPGRACGNGRPSPCNSHATAAAAIGLPTMLERPEHHGSRSPDRSPSSALSISRQPSGVQGTSPGQTRRQAAGIDDVEAVHILVRVEIASSTRAAIDMLRQGQLHQDALNRAGSALSSRHQRPADRLLRRCPSAGGMLDRMPGRIPAWCGPCCGHRPGSPRSSPTSTTARPGTRPVAAFIAAVSVGHDLRQDAWSRRRGRR